VPRTRMHEARTPAFRTPAQFRVPAQFRMPAEWEPHTATWLVWPHARDTWPGCLDHARDEFEQLIRAIARFEAVELLVPDDVQQRTVEALLRRTPTQFPVHIHIVPSDDSWVRDTGPTFVHRSDGSLAALDWRFNAWGGKYPPWERDQAVARQIAELAGVERIESGLTLEGGAIEVDGEGTFVATSSCVIDENRNPGTSREQIERELSERLGVERFLWVDASLTGDDTDGHVDNLVRFVAPGHVLCAVAGDASHPDHDSLETLRASLEDTHDARGRRLRVTPLPLPSLIECEGRTLPASYANFLITNGGVVAPCFGVASDESALDLLRKCFPTRTVVGVSARILVRGFGGPHCLSQQQPAPQPSVEPLDPERRGVLGPP